VVVSDSKRVREGVSTLLRVLKALLAGGLSVQLLDVVELRAVLTLFRCSHEDEEGDSSGFVGSVHLASKP
jgi:hypothetical protein